jgi:molybdopterin synthase catalytic subunit
MHVTVLYFAAARERTGLASEPLELPAPSTAAQALEAIFARHPALLPLRGHLRLAVDQEFAPADRALQEGAELALIPPVSGG